MSRRPSVLEDQLLGGEPAHALHEAALDLADVDGRIERAADIVEDIGAQQPVLARQRIDDHLRTRRAIGEVEERPARRLGAIPGDLRRLVDSPASESCTRASDAFLREFVERQDSRCR